MTMNLAPAATLFTAALGIAAIAPFARSAETTGAHDEVALTRQAIEDIALLDLSGESTTLARIADGGVLVLTYTGVGCPISGRYAPRLERLAGEWAKKGAHFVAIDANTQDSVEAIAAERKELEATYPALKDHRQELTRALGAETTTEVFVFDEEGSLRYRGAVDDQYSVGAARPQPNEEYLADALASIVAGETPAIAETEAPGCKLTVLPAEEFPETVTWAADIAPILQNNCESCHRPGQVGPFALQTYEQAKGWAQMISSVVEERRMPPWNADHRFDGVFENERSLTSAQREKIHQWVADGMPLGDAADAPAPKKWNDDWSIEDPDATFYMDRFFFTGEALPEDGYAVPREGTVEYQYFAVDTDFAEDKWIQQMEIRPGQPDVVHHVLVGILEKGRPFDDDSLLNYLCVAVPGDTPSLYPDGYAKRLPAGATLIFQLHYTTNGKARSDRSGIAMTFAEEEPIFEVTSQAILNQEFRIPAGDANFEVRDMITLTEDTGIISFFPHMHQRGKDFQYIAHYPDGEVEELLFSHYDFNWQETYIYPDPRFFPAGTKIECIAHYDNSPANPNNPDPEASVYWGDQSWEEMFVGYYDHVKMLE